MSNVQIRPVAGRRDRSAFIQLPYDLYRENPFWVPPLRTDVKRLVNPKKNAFFEHGSMQLFLAVDRDGRAVGRIAAIINGMHLKKYADETGFFGFFESVDDETVAAALFDAAAAWLREQGMKTMRGPANPSLNDTAGLLVDGFEFPPSLLMPYNHDYYPGFLDAYGFERSMTMWSYYLDTRYMTPEKLDRGAQIVLRRWSDLSIRQIDMSRFEEDARIIMDIYNDAWSENWGHVPMTEAEFGQLAGEMKLLVDPDLAVIVEDAGHPVGFAVALPDVNMALNELEDGRLLPFGIFKLLYLLKSNVIRHVRMPLMGVRRSHQGRGIDAVLIDRVIKDGTAKGVESCENSWVLDTNPRMIQALVALGAIPDKEYALFDKAI